LGTEWSSSADMSVYLNDAVAPAERQAIESALTGDVITERVYVSEGEARARFRKTFADLASGMEGLGDNPLPASYEVRLRTGADAEIDALVQNVRQLPGIADVRYDRQGLGRLLSAIAFVRGLGLALGILLAAAAALTV